MESDLQESEATPIDWNPELIQLHSGVESSSATVGTESCVSEGSEIIGTVVFEGPIVINGKMEGKIEGPGCIRVGQTGSVTTTMLRTGSIVIAGTVKVKSIASRRIEILPTGKVLGDLASPTLIIHEGAYFVGKSSAREEQPAPVTAGTRTGKSRE